MNKTLKWILIGLAIAVGVFIIALPIFTLVLGGGQAAIMDNWGWRDGMRTPYYHSPFMMRPLMGVFGLFHLLLPAAVLGLAVYGVVALARGARVNNAAPPPAAEVNCAACGRELVSGGELCPYCGTKQ